MEDEEKAEEPNQALHDSWTDLASNSYGDIPFDETTPDLLSTTSPSQLPVFRRHDQHIHLQNQHPIHHHHQHQHILDNHLHRPTSSAYVPHLHGIYNTLPEADTIGHFEYGNNTGPDLIPKISSEMRTGDRDIEGEVSGRRGGKRKRGDKYEEAGIQTKMDVGQRCDVCGELASGHYFGALVCLPCKSFFIRCTKDGRPNFNSQCGGKCDVLKGGRVRCQHCRFQKCISAGMYRKEKPEAVQPAEGQVLCKVCGDIANGVHFGVTTCEGCKKFFRRGLKENKTYNCKGNMRCSINPRMRNNCRFCRYQKCLYEGMSREAIKMGRPKKGEIGYRKPLKKSGMKPLMKDFYDKQIPESMSLSISSESNQDEDALSTSNDIFDPLSVTQHLHLQPDTRHLNSQMQHSHLNNHQPQQPETFSLGSILHECMTVRDWELKVEMSDLEDNVTCSQSGVMPSSSSSINGRGIMDECGQISPRVRPSSPGMLSDMLGRQSQQMQHHLQQHPQHIKGVEHLQADLQTRRQIARYENQTSNAAANMANNNDIGFHNQQDFQANRPIKIEDVSLQVGHGYGYSDDVVLNEVNHLQTLGKTNFQGYQMQCVDPNSAYNVSSERATTTMPSRGTMFIPVSQSGLSAGSHISASNMSSQGMLYMAHQPQESVPGALSHHQHANNFTQNHQNFEQSKMNQDSSRNEITNHQHQGLNRLLSSCRNYQMMTENTIIRSKHNQRISSSHSNNNNISMSPPNTCAQFYNSSHKQQFASESIRGPANNGLRLAFESTSPRRSGSVNEDSLAALSFPGQHTSSLPTSFASPSEAPLNAHPKLSGIRRPVAAILQQHRDATQTGRPVHLSPEEVDHVMNTVNVDQQRAHEGFRINNEPNLLTDQRGEYHSIVDLRRHSLDNFQVKTEQVNEVSHCSRQTSPSSARSLLENIPTSQYRGNSPMSLTVSEVHRRQYLNQSMSSDSNSSDRLELHSGYPGINNKSNNNNNESQINHYGYQDNYNDSLNQNYPKVEVIDDSFNSALIRDSTFLHEINRIFLGIDNSCETYGCSSPNVTAGDNHQNDDVSISCVSTDEFSPEISHRYWHGCQPSQRFVLMTPDRQHIISDVLDAFDDLQKTYVTNEPEYLNKMSQDNVDHWHLIQRRIARHVVAGQRFCRNIPGYFKLDIQDRISLGKHVGFGLMVLIACTEFYDPEFKRFKHIWNWTIPMQNPLFSYKVHLLSLGDRIHEINLDKTEASMMCAISMTSIDCPNLVNPEIVRVVRDSLIDALRAHIFTKSESTVRLKKLMSFMPQVRLMTVWYNNLMKKMSLPSEIINIKTNKPTKLHEIEDTENTPSIS